MIEVRNHAAARRLERAHDRPVVVQIRIRAIECSVVNPARQSVHTLVIPGCALAVAIVVWASRRVCQCTEVIVKRMILLHHDDDVVYLVQVSVRKRRSRSEQAQDGCQHPDCIDFLEHRSDSPEIEWQGFHHRITSPVRQHQWKMKMLRKSSTPPTLSQQLPRLDKLLHRPRRGKITRRNPALAIRPLVKLPYSVHT